MDPPNTKGFSQYILDRIVFWYFYLRSLSFHLAYI